MYDFNITAAEMSAFYADMADLMSDILPTEAEMTEMAAYYGE
jgi:hypothetical protein